MTLDEAIKHCEEIAMDKTNLAQTLWDRKEKARCEDCAEEYNQLAQWLIELKMLKTEQEPKIDVFDKIRAEIDELDRYYDTDYFSTNNCPMYKCNEVLLIIDKYGNEVSE